MLPYLTLPSGRLPRHTSAEASIWAQRVTPTDLMVEEISYGLRLLQTSGELQNGVIVLIFRTRQIGNIGFTFL